MNQRNAWAAVVNRDPEADEKFVFAVETTGIYCRASCPAKRPRRENVRFYGTPAEAERAGFRACKRCGVPRDSLVARAREAIDRALEQGDRPTLATIAEALDVSPFHLQRTFKRAMGVSPRAYVTNALAARFRASKEKDVLGAAFAAGYGSSRALYESAKSALAMTPGAFRRGGEGEHLLYTVRRTLFGFLLVATTSRGVARVALGDSERALVDALSEELPRAAIARDDHGLAATVDAVLASTTRPSNDVPLDLRGTALELRVWSALRRIPPGETRTYSEIAEAIGASPSSARAVARACAKNPVALVVPCHRVIGKDGDLRGYRWGIARKKRILTSEAST